MNKLTCERIFFVAGSLICIAHNAPLRCSQELSPMEITPSQHSTDAQQVKNQPTQGEDNNTNLPDWKKKAAIAWEKRKASIRKSLTQDGVKLNDLERHYHYQTREGAPPLKDAVKNNDIPFVQWLIDVHGADVTTRYNYDQLLLYSAETVAMAKLLLKYSPDNYLTSHGTKLLADIVFEPHKHELIAFYVTQGADPNNLESGDSESMLTLLAMHNDPFRPSQKLVAPIIASNIFLDHKVKNGEWKGYTAPQIIKQKLETYQNGVRFSLTQQLRQSIIKTCDEKKNYIDQALDEHVIPDVRNIVQAYTETSYEELENQDMTELRRSYDAEMKRQADEEEARAYFW